jgi:hypothetical protein
MVGERRVVIHCAGGLDKWVSMPFIPADPTTGYRYALTHNYFPITAMPRENYPETHRRY